MQIIYFCMYMLACASWIFLNLACFLLISTCIQWKINLSASLDPFSLVIFFPEYLFSHIVVLVELFMIFLWSGYISALCISLKWEDSFILASSLWLSVLQIITSMFPEKLELLENHRSTFWTIFTIYELGVKYRASHLRYCLAVCLIMKMHKSAYFLCCNL